MKKIAYIELDTHAEIANNFYELSQEFKSIEVDFYFSERVFKLLNIHQENVYLSDLSIILDQLKKKHYDEIIIGTAHRYFYLYFAIIKNYKTSIIVHNCNFSKTNSKQLFYNIFKNDVKYRIKLFLKEGLSLVPKIYKKANRLLTIDKAFSDKSNLVFVPVFYNEFNSDKRTDDCIKIVVPGTVSQSRRDYTSFLQKLERFKDINVKYQISFLGKASGKELDLIKRVSNKLPSFISLNYFEDKIPQHQFDEIMQKADLLYCPIQTKTQFFSVTEIYGKTKTSGNIGDAIRYGKLAIFPANYESQLAFILNEKQDLQSQFSEVINLEFDFSSFSKYKVSSELETVLNH